MESVTQMLNQDSVEELCELISLGEVDVEILSGIDEDYNIALPGLQIIISEICRYAIHSILEADSSHPIILQGDEEVEEVTHQEYTPFYTLRFNSWVEHKARAILLPFGVPECQIRRALLVTLSRNYNNQIDEEIEWKDADRYEPSYLDVGELLRLRNGQNLPAPDRILDEENNHTVFPIVSSKPTRMFLHKIQVAGCYNTRIEHRGMIRLIHIDDEVDLERLIELYPVTQPVSSFIGIPPILYPLLEESEGIDQMTQDAFLDLLDEQITPINFERFRDEVDDAELRCATRDNSSPTYSFQGNVHLHNAHGLRQCGIIRAKFQMSSTRYFFTVERDLGIPNGRVIGNSGTLKIFEIPPLWYRYALRLFSVDREQDPPPLIIIHNPTSFTLNRQVFASGNRLLLLYGASKVFDEDGRFRRRYTCEADLIGTLVNLLCKWNFYRVAEDE
jgi:hypothetical protein